MPEPRAFALVPAAGMGRRMGTDINKQYLLLGGMPIVARTLQVLQQCELISGIILVTPEQEIPFCCREVVERYSLSKVLAIVPGGSERQQSVMNGLRELQRHARPEDIVLIHDGVRPFIDIKLLQQTYQTACETGAALVAVPVKDTIKTVSNTIITGTPDRSSLWQAQTPQAFRFDLILQAHVQAEQDRFLGTDDCSLVERTGAEIRIVPGNYRNIKITTPEDIIVAEAFLAHQPWCF